MERRILQYTVVQGTAEELARIVNSMISQGWQPLGGVAVAANRMSIGRLDCTFTQAMVLYEGAARTAAPASPPPVPTGLTLPPSAPARQ